MDRAVHLLTDYIHPFKIKNLKSRTIEAPGKTPLILIEVDSFGCTDAGNVLLYGHFDKQPEFEGWHEGKGPWTPVQEIGRLYGRGAGDDGYAIFSCLSAIEALQSQGHMHPKCVILIEGCEESGSPDLPYYIDYLQEEIGDPDLVICLDAECGNYDQLWLSTSVRGMLCGTLKVNVLTEGVHSGAAGGIVPSSFRVLRQLLERVEDAKTGELVDELTSEIPDWVHQQSSEVAETLGNTIIDRYPWATREGFEDINLERLVTANTWKPSVETVGLGGAPKPKDAGNTLRPYTEATLVFRLPPNANGDEMREHIKQAFERDTPRGAQIELDFETSSSGWSSDSVEDWLDVTLNDSSHQFFGRPYKKMGTGGTIPFLKMLNDKFPRCQFMVTGVLGPGSNAHGPNEFLDIKTAERVTCCVAYALNALAHQKSQPVTNPDPR